VTLAFLRPSAGPAADPAAESPFAEPAAAAGARIEVRDGWRVAVAFPDSGAAAAAPVRFTDRSHLAKLELQAGPGAEQALAALPAAGRGLAARADGAWWCRTTPARMLVLAEAAALAGVHERIARDAPSARVLDLSAAFAALTLDGPLAREAIARFCALDLRPHLAPVGAWRPGSVARTPGFMLREGEERYLLLVGAAYARYAWTVVADAAGRLGGRPAGVDELIADPEPVVRA